MFRSKKEPQKRTLWNKGKLVDQKSPFSMQDICSVRTRLQTNCNHRDLALFNLAIDSKLRGCDLVGLRVSDVAGGGEILAGATVRQRKQSDRYGSKLQSGLEYRSKNGSTRRGKVSATTCFQVP